MEIKTIKSIVESSVSDYMKEELILSHLAQDKNIIPKLLQLLDLERKQQKDLLLDTNLELSRALVALKDNENIIEKPFVVGEIINHYKKWKDVIGCCFKIKELE